MTHIVCTPNQAGFALATLADEIRLSAIFMGDGLEVPEEYAELVATAITTVTANVAALSLAAVKNEMIGVVNAAAEKERLKYITSGQGQAMTYTEKRDQARAFLAADDPDPADYPMIANEVGITAATAREVAEVIAGRYAAWKAIGEEIEKVRMIANKAIEDAADEAAAKAAAAGITWPAGG